jgi:hypothetical protein
MRVVARSSGARVKGSVMAPRLLAGFCLCAISIFSTAHAQETVDFVQLVPIGPAYAENDINVISFRQKALTSVVKGEQTFKFASYYYVDADDRR